MKTTFSIQFYCRPSKTTKDGFAPVEMVITNNGERVVINLPRKEKPDDFQRLMKSRKPNELKTFTDLMRSKIYDVQNSLIMDGQPMTANNLREYFRTGGIKSYTYSDLFKDFSVKLIGENVTISTYRKYVKVMDLWSELCPRDKEIKTVTNVVAREFYNSLQKTYEQSTVAGMATKIKCVFQYAVDNGKLSVNPFTGIKIAKGEKDVEFLMEDEINQIINTPMPTPSLERVKHLFLWMCGTGQSYADMAQLTPEDVQEVDGHRYISKNRQKTGVEYTTIVLPFASEIYDLYKGKLPIISNQRMNIYLKAVQGAVGLKKRLHCHMARHSFACLALNKGIRIETVAKALGHSSSNLRQTAHYAKLLKRTVISELSIMSN